MIVAAIAALFFASIPAMMFLANYRLFKAISSPNQQNKKPPNISVLIPARDEAKGIQASVSSVLASTGCNVEVVVLDDQSTDNTAQVVAEIAKNDSRVRCVSGQPLPDGWNGKQFACHQLSQIAKYDVLVFMDADVRLRSTALATLEDYRDANEIDLLSAFPHQQTGTWLEQWIIPLMHYLLLGYLPFSRMRSTRDPSLAAGCGQLFMTTRDAYHRAGTHQSIASSRHDGIKLPRAYRTAGLVTDVVDGTELAECRMYQTASEVIRGVLKNAHEGIAQPKLILVFTVLMLGGSVMPLVVLAFAMFSGHAVTVILAVTGVLVGHLPRAIAAKQFRQPIAGVLFHSASVAVFIALQWIALVFALSGRQIEWRGRKEKVPQVPRTT
jgi:Glycosyl transferase family 2